MLLAALQNWSYQVDRYV